MQYFQNSPTTKKQTAYQEVDSMADDAITVRISSTSGTISASLDFPSFLDANGKLLKSSALPQNIPPDRCFSYAHTILPITPFIEIVVKLEADVDWQPEWGQLIRLA